MKPDRFIIRAFRGFQEEKSIPLSPSLTVIYGENERGKTSLCEGWHWLFTNELLEDLDPQSELRSAESNIHIEVDPRVRLVDEDDEVLIERENNQFRNLGDLPSTTSPALLQYRLQQVLYTSQGDRREFFEKVMELDVESDFSQTLRQACQNIDPSEHPVWDTWETALRGAQEQDFEVPHPSPSTSDEQQENEQALLEFLGEYFGCDPTPDALEGAISSPSDDEEETEFPIDQITHDVPEDLEADIEETLDSIDDLDREAEQAFERAQWRQHGLTFADPPECPFCTENTLDEKKIESINRDIEQTKTRTEAHRDAKSDLTNTITSILPLAAVSVGETQSHIETLLDNLPERDVDFPEGLPSNLEELHDALEELAEARPAPPEKLEEELLNSDAFSDFVPSVVELSRIWALVVPQLETLKENLEGQRDRIDFTDSATNALRYFEEDRTNFYLELDAGEVLNELADAAPDAVNRLKQSRLRHLTEDIERFYEILRPHSPTPLKEIEIAGGVRGDVRIRAESMDKVEHASKLFSYSNANALGMAAHIARVLDAVTCPLNWSTRYESPATWAAYSFGVA